MHSWIPTYTGRVIDFKNPNPNQIHVIDIAQGLASACRFCGQIAGHYSVAEHSVLVSRHVSDQNRLYALFHDAAEAYTGDVVAPLKELVPEYSRIESRLMAAIWDALGVPPPAKDSLQDIKSVERRLLAAEKNQVTNSKAGEWPTLVGVVPLGVRIHFLERSAARDFFLARFNELCEAQVA